MPKSPFLNYRVQGNAKEGEQSMKIGLTYDLRSSILQKVRELETAELTGCTIDALENSLKALGTDRPHRKRRSLINRLSMGVGGTCFNIAEGLKGIGREAQVPAIWIYIISPTPFPNPLS
jgi:D-alanine-D-alanine ligase